MTRLKVEISGDSMWPTFSSGQRLDFEQVIDPTTVSINDVVLAQHPLKPGVLIVKRVKRMEGQRFFLEGDHPDPLASEDSHNFGSVLPSSVLGVWFP